MIYAQYIHCNGSYDFKGICNNLKKKKIINKILSSISFCIIIRFGDKFSFVKIFFIIHFITFTDKETYINILNKYLKIIDFYKCF